MTQQQEEESNLQVQMAGRMSNQSKHRRFGCKPFLRHKHDNVIQCDYCGQQETFDTVTEVKKPWTKGYFPFKRGWNEWLFPVGLLVGLATAAIATILIRHYLYGN